MDAHEITTRLPPRREDEPASLRQDIVDEILDHLQCGLRRELLVQGGDEASAKERVLDRFGDPREVARKLWYQAMWSQIMSQRIVVGSALFSMLVCTALVGVLIWVMQQQQQANAAMLQQIVKLIPQPAPATEPLQSRGARKSHLRLKVTRETEEGAPAKISYLTVTKQPELGQQAGENGNALSFSVDESGIADCGLTPPGRFEATIRTALGESTRVMFTIPSDEDHIEHIVVPDKLAEMTNVVFRIQDFPEGLVTHSMGLVMRVRPRGSRLFFKHAWSPTGRWPGLPLPLLLLTNQTDGLQMLTEPDATSSSFSENNAWTVVFDDSIRRGKWEPPREWSLPSGSYSVQFGLMNNGNGEQRPWMYLDGSGKAVSGAWLRGLTQFVAEPGKVNEWTILLPDTVSMCIRDPMRLPDVVDPSSFNQGGGMGGGMQGGGFGGGGMGGGGGGFF